MSDPGCRLFVGNLSWNTTDESMRMAFEDGAGVPGSVLDSKVILDRDTGRSRYVLVHSFALSRVPYLRVLNPFATYRCCHLRRGGNESSLVRNHANSI